MGSCGPTDVGKRSGIVVKRFGWFDIRGMRQLTGTISPQTITSVLPDAHRQEPPWLRTSGNSSQIELTVAICKGLIGRRCGSKQIGVESLFHFGSPLLTRIVRFLLFGSTWGRSREMLETSISVMVIMHRDSQRDCERHPSGARGGPEVVEP